MSSREVGPERQFSPGLAAKKNAGLLGVGVGVSRLECGWPLNRAAEVDSIIVVCFKEPTAAEGEAIFDSNILITGA